MERNMPRIRRITAAVEPRILLTGAIFAVVLIAMALLTAFVLVSLPEGRFPFWTSAEGIAVAEAAVALVLTFGLLPALLLWLSAGRITVDSSGMRWNIRGERGEIRWDRPFALRRWRSVLSTTTYGDSGPAYEMDFPVIVYEISQSGTSITLYRGAGWNEVKDLPFGELRGAMLFLRARRLTGALDALSR